MKRIFVLLMVAVYTHTDAATFTVINTNDTGGGSLRAAISNANLSAGNTIDFNIAGAGVWTITPSNALPTIINPVTLDGYTQGIAHPNTLTNGDDAVLLIELNGVRAVGAVGLLITAGNSTVRGLVINRFAGGITCQTKGSNRVEGCFIGTDPSGTLDLGNSNSGVSLFSSGTNTVGGTSPSARNIISGNTLQGVGNLGAASSFNLIQGNYIGTDRTGTFGITNGAGITVSSANNVTIGGTTPGAGNLISANSGIGINISGNGNVVQGNLIGVDVTGTNRLGNGNNGITVFGLTNTIGGASVAARNVISGNRQNGVGFSGAGNRANTIQGNFIGTDATGTDGLGNTANGVTVTGPIGTEILDNVISDNGGAGIAFNSATATIVQGNFIGTDVTGTQPYGNGGFGVSVFLADNSIIGGTAPGEGNIIAFNSITIALAAGGVLVSSSTNVAILGNSIFSNTGIGIDLGNTGGFGNGLTANDACDADNGANHFQNFPVLTLATNTASGIRIDGTLNSASNTIFTLEFFDNSVCDSSGNGEGETFIGATNVTTVGCDASFSVTFTNILPVCDVVTATATDPNNNTSEFSPCEIVQGNPPVVLCTLSPALATNLVGVTHVVTNLVTKDGQPAAGVVVFTRITSGPNAGLSAVATNDANGLIEFSYTSNTNGTDTITTTGRVCAVNFTCTATKVWIFTPNIPPVANCQNVTKNANGSCQATVLATEVDNGSMDPDGSLTNRVLSPAGPFTVGNSPVTLTVFDNRGATASCMATVTVVDATPPSISCPGNIVTSAPPGQTNTVVTFGAPTSSDNCSGLITNCTPPSGSTFALGTNTVICRAIDLGGNTNTCTFTIIVNATVSNTAPIAVCQNVTAPAGANCTTNVPASAVDNGSSDPDGTIASRMLSPAGPYAKGTNSVTLTVVDNLGASNSCNATIIVVDTTLPSVSCAGTIITNLPAGVSNAVVNFSAPVTSDNCGIANTSCSPSSGSPFSIGTNLVICTAVDTSGNTNTCSFNIIVTSAAPNIPPAALCSNATVSANAGCQATVPALAVDAGSSDPDGNIASRSLSPAGPYSLGTNSVTLTVFDNNGASNSCNAQVIVVDATPPTIGPCANITTNLPVGVTNAIVTFATPTTGDNCGVASVVCVPASGSTFDLGTTPVACTVTDNSGNTNSCSFSVTVQAAAPETHDLALIKLKAPKNINLKGSVQSLTKFVKVTLQNRSPHDEAITDLTGLVTLVAESLSNVCPNATVVLHNGPPNKTKTLKPKQKLTVTFDVTYDCANDPAKGEGHEDFRFHATVHHDALGTGSDTHTADDNCPRAPLPGGVDNVAGLNIKDTGCAGGVDVKTDVFIKE